MPSNAPVAYERKVSALCPALSRGQVKKLASRIYLRAERMHAVDDFYRALRILGATPDPTAYQAIKNMEAAA